MAIGLQCQNDGCGLPIEITAKGILHIYPVRDDADRLHLEMRRKGLSGCMAARVVHQGVDAYPEPD